MIGYVEPIARRNNYSRITRLYLNHRQCRYLMNLDLAMWVNINSTDLLFIEFHGLYVCILYFYLAILARFDNNSEWVSDPFLFHKSLCYFTTNVNVWVAQW